MSTHDPSRRQFVKTVAYVAPAILTLKAMPSYAAVGSGETTTNNQTGDSLDRERLRQAYQSGDQQALWTAFMDWLRKMFG
jgi:hypothetical protein